MQEYCNICQIVHIQITKMTQIIHPYSVFQRIVNEYCTILYVILYCIAQYKLHVKQYAQY